eukprot:6563773-Alexandrium_andersonii.AAC.1
MAASLDGASGAEGLASLGAHGRHAQNLQRDFMRHAKRSMGIRWELYPVRTVGISNQSSASIECDIPVLLPVSYTHLTLPTICSV